MIGMEDNGYNLIRIKYFEDDLPPIEKFTYGDWIDLRAAETVTLKPMEYACIRLGVAMELPLGYEAHVVPRSSTFAKWGIIQTNSMGVIDNSYCGDGDEWRMPVLAIRETTINKGDRICQFRIFKNQEPNKFEMVDHLRIKNRGGFGSTGTK